MDDRLTWAMRRMALFAAVRQAVTGRHVYLSTGCLAERHDYCASMTGWRGEKRPARAKFSDALCICRCHRASRRRTVAPDAPPGGNVQRSATPDGGSSNAP